MKMSDKLYDTLKYINQVAFPAVITAAAAIMALFNVDPATIATITGIAAALNTCLGTILGVSQVNYARAQQKIAEEKLETENNVK